MVPEDILNPEIVMYSDPASLRGVLVRMHVFAEPSGGKTGQRPETMACILRVYPKGPKDPIIGYSGL